LKHVQLQRLLAKFFVVHGGVSYEEKKGKETESGTVTSLLRGNNIIHIWIINIGAAPQLLAQRVTGQQANMA